MNEIEKLYENAGIEPRCNIYPTFYDCARYPHEKCEDCVEWEYPPFTAEKQVELIKLLGSVRDYTVEIDKFKGAYYVGCRSAGSNDKLWGSSNTFEDALAELINETWFYLTEEEIEHIRGILKG